MQRLGLRNKRLLINGFIILAVLSGITLSYFMHKYIGEVGTEYFPEEGVYGIPFNIGFRSSALYGAAAIVLFQSSFYVASGCNRKYYMETMLSGIWFANAIIVPEISSSSKVYFYLGLRDNCGYDMGFDFYRIWDYVEYGIYFVVIAIAFRYLYIWLFVQEDNDAEDTEIANKWRIPSIIIAVIGSILLVVRSYTNIWYILLCYMTFVISLIVLKGIEILWIKCGLNRKKTMGSSLFDKMLYKLFEMEECDEYAQEYDDDIELKDDNLYIDGWKDK